MRSVFTVMLFSLTLMLSAQGFRGGFRFGLTGTQVQGDMISGFDKAGLCGGFLVSFPLNEQSELEMELLFVQKGSRRNPTKDSPFKYIMRLNYIEIPLLYRRKINKTLGFETGLSFGVLSKTTDVEYDINGLMPARAPFESYEVAAHAGFTWFVNERGSFNLRYSHSVLPIRPHPGGVTYYLNRGQYNLVLALTYEYHF